jgi:multisubunit Na+/H+ antiporter MnhG subunit
VSKAAQIRRVLFVCGIAALAISVALVVGSYLRPVKFHDYFKQADEARPWVNWGMDSALIGFAFCFFGTGRWRIVSAVLGFVLLLWWYGAGMALV